ncbi:hypothetical protein [Naasia lichenicola]|uniref:Uncharacterized protein n=1 Tax=Naasia lichenicola TaxID=2565933 RepID=A0A4S4FJ87_9MICO|nr:hypothetical protein [Naasia lichenicola]THG29964.1 hypothetical protein E6C64_15075 [Naasia lichenicola]
MFGRRKPPLPAADAPQPGPAGKPLDPSDPVDSVGTQAVMRQVQARLAEEPLLGAKIAGQELLHNVMTMLSNERGVQIEVAATIFGGLAGRACLLAALAGQAGDDPALNAKTINSLGMKDGSTLLIGDALNWQLAEGPHSVYALIGGYLRSAGEPIPDAGEFFAHSVQSLGGPTFGVPRFAPGTGAGSTPLEYADALWATFSNSLRRYAPDPQLWPISYGIAIQQMLELAKSSGLDLGVIVRVVMDSALAVAKVPVKVPAA